MAATTPVRRKKKHFRNQSTKAPYEVELEYGEDGEQLPPPGDDHDEHAAQRWVPLRDLNHLEGETGFDLVRIGQTDPQRALRILVGEGNWPRFWAEYRTETFGGLQQMMNEAIEHYSGTTSGNS